MKLSKLMVAMLASMALVACGGNSKGESSSQATSISGETSTSEVVTDTLAWMSTTNTLRVDLYGELGLTFKYGDAELQGGVVINFDDTKTMTYTGEPAQETYNFVYVLKGNDGGNVTIVNRAIVKESLGEYFSDILNKNLKGKVKGYLAIGTGTDLQWDKTLSTAMNDSINRLNIA